MLRVRRAGGALYDGEAVLTPAESLIGLSRHLSMYALGPDRAALGNLEFAGHVLEISIRLRSSGVSRARRVHAITLDAGIPVRRLEGEILPVLESLGWAECARNEEGELEWVSEQVPPLSELVNSADSLLRVARPTNVERAVLSVLDATTVMPLTRDAAIEAGTTEASEEEAERAIDYLDALNLAEVRRSEDGHVVVYNPNIWSLDADLSAAALRAEDSSVRDAIGGLIEEVSATPGMPQDLVTSTTVEWIDYAVAKGLVHRSLVVTSEENERAFLFTPHMSRNAFQAPSGVDPSGHVRQLIGSMMYANKFAKWKLRTPGVFLSRLIAEGEAGDASSIGTDYPMLETAGIVRVEPAERFFKLVLLQSDVAEQALTFLQQAEGRAGSDAMGSGLRDQRKYVHPERQRAQVGRQAATKPGETERLIAALREEAGRRRFGY